jgi:hypothetical protein
MPDTTNPQANRPVDDMRELYAVQHAITDAGGTLTPAVHRAIDALRERWDAGLRRAQAAPAAVPVPASAPTDRAAVERLGRIREWVTSDVVTARNEFGSGYREALRDILDLLDGRPAADAVSGPGGAADETQAVAVDPAAIEAAALRKAADRYATLADQNEAYDRERGDLDEAARIQHEAVRDVAIGLRRMADEVQQSTSCSARPCNEAADELCDAHAQIRYHALGEHAFCDPGCDAEQPAAEPQPAPPVEHCIHVKAIHDTHHHTPVTGCPWCTAATGTEA